jgi:phosphoglycerate kinase
MAKLILDNLSVSGKKVLVRVDFNVPINDGVISDDSRITAALPTIEKLVNDKAIVMLTSHLGRPKSKNDTQFSLKIVADHLKTLLPSKNVTFVDDCIGKKVDDAVSAAKEGDIILLENVRFYPEETKNDEAFAKALAKNADVFVNDAFGSSHRAHASVAGVTAFVDQSASGYLLQKEIKFLQEAVDTPKRPFVAILGGAKVSDKIGVIENLLNKVDTIIIGGGMAYTFLKSQGIEIGKSLLEADKMDLAATLIEKAKAKGVNLMLPKDFIIADDFSADANTKEVDLEGILPGWEALDIGPKSAAQFSKVIEEAKTVLWNGPMGVFEFEAFAKGTNAVAKALVNATEKGAITIIGGGDSASAIQKAGYKDQVSHVSTGGGASLEFLEGKGLPGVEALSDQ